VKRGAFIKFVRLAFLLAFDTGIVLENELELELEVESRMFLRLDEIDRYFCGTISILLRSNERPYIPFKQIYLIMEWS
jgi:hypothetical protein